jgi:hypothetical protein
MQRNTMAGLALFILVTISGTSQAQPPTIYSGGGTYTVDGSSGPIEVLGSTLNIESNADIAGYNTYPFPQCVVYADSTSTINLNGGLISPNPSIQDDYMAGIDSTGTFTATGGICNGYSYALSLVCASPGSVQISGGTFTGLAPLSPGIGAIIVSYSSESFLISGGTFEGNAEAGAISGGGGIGLALDALSGSSGSITGGTFIGDGGGKSLVYTGESNTSLNISGGNFANSLVYTGESNTSLNISGGNFATSMILNLASVNSSVNFFGTDFQLIELAPGLYDLTGILSDGDAINVTVFTTEFGMLVRNSDGQEEVTFAIPEPSSIVTLASGLAGVAAVVAFRTRRLGHKPGA